MVDTNPSKSAPLGGAHRTLTQKAYFGKIKMIYIDPPYNTGGEFIYPDKYAETLDTYLAYTGQLDDEGNKFSTNTEQVGRHHSRWLRMIYPRLYLARFAA